MKKLQAKLASLIESLLKDNPLLNKSCYKDTNKTPAISIFGFDVDNANRLPQIGIEIITVAKQLGQHGTSYLSPNNGKSGQIYIGKSAKAATAVSEDVESLDFS